MWGREIRTLLAEGSYVREVLLLHGTTVFDLCRTGDCLSYIVGGKNKNNNCYNNPPPPPPASHHVVH